MEKQNSQYYQYGVDETVKRYRTKLHINTYIFVLFAVAGLVWIFIHGVHDFGALCCEYLFIICLLVIYQVTYYAHFPRLTQILMRDCDPYKFYEVLSRLDKYDRRGKAKNTLLFYKAVCCFYMNEHTEEGLSYLKSIHFKKKVLPREARVLLLFSSYARLKGDRESFDLVKKDLESLPHIISHRKMQKKEYDETYMFFQAAELIWDGGHEKAYKLINELLSRKISMLNRVSLNMHLARLDIKMNEKVNAKIHLEYVVEHGNTMSIVEEAKELLDRQFYIDRLKNLEECE